LEEQHAEAIKPRVLQSQPVLRFIHTEAAWTARARGKEHVLVDDFLARHPVRLQALQVLHQISHREIGWIALAVVSVFFPELERGHVRNRENSAGIATGLKNGLNDFFVLPRQSAEEDGDFAALLRGEGSFYGAAEVMRRAVVQTQPPSQTLAL